nr:uncharacterized protein LOC109179592 [Ipomoea trifida]
MVSASGTSHPSRRSPSLSHPLKLSASISAAASNSDLHEHNPARTSEAGASGTVELLETEIDFATMVEADVPTVKYHLAKHGFVSDYFVWRFHGERIVTADVDRDVGGPSQMTDEEASNAYHTMVMDAAGVQFNVDEIEESPNPEAQKFYDMLKAADQGLFPECKKHSQLSFVARLMSLKSENHISEKCFNQITELIKEVVPEDNLVPDNFYETKRLLRGYYVNGFKFHTIGYGGAKETMNSGVCIKGINYSVDESDYYGRLVEVVQVEYPGLPIKRTVLFKCDWFDPTSVGMKVHSKYKLVEVNHKRRLNRYEPFVLAMQAAQVYYCTYPSLRRDKLDWWAVCKIKARSNVEVPESSISTEDSLIPPPFQEETTDNHDLVQIDEDLLHLDDPNGGVIELDGEHGDIEDEIELEEEIDDSSSDSVTGDSDNGTDS